MSSRPSPSSSSDLDEDDCGSPEPGRVPSPANLPRIKRMRVNLMSTSERDPLSLGEMDTTACIDIKPNIAIVDSGFGNRINISHRDGMELVEPSMLGIAGGSSNNGARQGNAPVLGFAAASNSSSSQANVRLTVSHANNGTSALGVVGANNAPGPPTVRLVNSQASNRKEPSGLHHQNRNVKGDRRNQSYKSNARSSSRTGEEPSSSQGVELAEFARLQAQLKERDQELRSQRLENEKFLKELQDSVECPVCFAVPRAPPVPCCQNGHVICSKCKDKVDVCPTCRVQMGNCVSQVAATIIQKIQHPCDFKEVGCDVRCDINTIGEHEESCQYRLVRCPHWACDEQICLTALTSHVITSECGDNYMSKPLPYQEEIEYTRELDDHEGNSFWRPSLLQFQDITFYLQFEKCGRNKQWYFYVQMEGSASECEKFETKITVCKYATGDSYSICYTGKVCPIDIKGAEELDLHAYGLNVRDAVMEKIFVIDTDETDKAEDLEFQNESGLSQISAGGCLTSRGGGSQRSATLAGLQVPGGGEKEEGEVGDHGEEEGERFKFWVKVDIFRACPHA